MDHGISVFPHPPSSPDVNPIEPVWHELKKLIQALPCSPTTVPKLIQAVRDAWDTLAIPDIDKYIHTMSDRLRQSTGCFRGRWESYKILIGYLSMYYTPYNFLCAHRIVHTESMSLIGGQTGNHVLSGYFHWPRVYKNYLCNYKTCNYNDCDSKFFWGGICALAWGVELPSGG
jgi:hypothetical protein